MSSQHVKPQSILRTATACTYLTSVVDSEVRTSYSLSSLIVALNCVFCILLKHGYPQEGLEGLTDGCSCWR